MCARPPWRRTRGCCRRGARRRRTPEQPADDDDGDAGRAQDAELGRLVPMVGPEHVLEKVDASRKARRSCRSRLRPRRSRRAAPATSRTRDDRASRRGTRFWQTYRSTISSASAAKSSLRPRLPGEPDDADYQRLLELRTGLRQFLHWSEQQATIGGPHPRAAPAAARDPRPRGTGGADDRRRGRGPVVAPSQRGRARRPRRGRRPRRPTRRPARSPRRAAPSHRLGARRLRQLSGAHLEELRRLAPRHAFAVGEPRSTHVTSMTRPATVRT